MYIATIKKEGRTAILTTHYREEAQRLCDRVAIIVKGRIAAMGRVTDLVSKAGVF